MTTSIGSPAHMLAPASASTSAAPDWMLHTLWATREGVHVSTTPPRDGRAVERFAVLPSAADPRFLLPLSRTKAASHALREYRTGRRGDRVLRALLAAGIRSHVAQPLLRARVHVSVTQDVDPAVRPGLMLREHVREIVAREDVEIAVDLAAARRHGTPTFHIVGHDGTALGVGKIGSDGVSGQLVANEARMLARLGERIPPVREFEFPQLLHAGRWRQLELLIAAPPPSGGRRRVLPRLPLAATDQVASLWGTDRRPLAVSRYWGTIRSRAHRAASIAGPSGESLPAIAERLEQRHGGTMLAFGSCHGAWAPWNMEVIDGRLYVRGWERSSDLAPCGIDAVHFVHASELRQPRASAAHALPTTLERTRLLLPRLGVAAAHAELLIALHLLEMSLRAAEARPMGVDPADRRYADALAALVHGPDAGWARTAA
jgi:hypothetical protein